MTAPLTERELDEIERNIRSFGSAASMSVHMALNVLAMARASLAPSGGGVVPVEPEDGGYVLRFAEAGIPAEWYHGHGSRDAAYRRWEQCSVGYNCYLYQIIPDDEMRRRAAMLSALPTPRREAPHDAP